MAGISIRSRVHNDSADCFKHVPDVIRNMQTMKVLTPSFKINCNIMTFCIPLFVKILSIQHFRSQFLRSTKSFLKCIFKIFFNAT